jgi:hypothetical protein
MKNEGALKTRFSQAWRNLSVRCVITACKPGPGYRFPVGSGPGYRTRRKKHALPTSSAMSSGRLFLDGVLASIARLRFTGILSIKPLPPRMESFIIER